MNALAAGDFSAVTLNNSPLFSALQSSAAFNAINSIELNALGLNYISSAGPTKLGTRSSYDVNNTGENLPEENTAATFSESPTNKPYLLVEYRSTAPATFSISGSVSATSPPTGTVRITATPVSGGTVGATTIASQGAYSIGGLTAGATFNISAYIDEDNDSVKDPLEWTGDYSGNLLLDANKADINITLINPATIDSDGDGLPDAWEDANGLDRLSAVGINGASGDRDGDGLSNAQELWLGTRADMADTDGDGLTDLAEVNGWGTNPLLIDSDNDGLPDKWETDNGLDPRRDDAGEDRDSDFVNNRDEYNGGTNSTKANSGDSDNDGVSDYVQAHGGQSTWQALYDRNDRLLGVRNARGSSFAYRYDGNGNITRQIKLGFDSDGDGLSDLWEFAKGLDPNSANGSNGSTGDADGDGWTNLQEQLAGSDPNDASSKPGANGSVIGSLTAPFTPTNFVAAAGQLDNAGSEEIVVGADGNPGTSSNFIRIYTEAGGVWKAESVDVGSYGVTSIAVSQVVLRAPAIYVGLRNGSGTGRVIELVKTLTGWQTSVVVNSLTTVAYVTGIRATATGSELAITLSQASGIDGALYRAINTAGAWSVTQLLPQASHRGSGIVAKAASGGTDRILRLLDAGGIQVTDTATTVETEPAAVHRLQWAGKSLAAGRFNASTPTQQSVVEAFIEDKDASNTVTAGDEFVIAELVLGSSPAVTRTLSRRTLNASALTAGYGFAGSRTRAGTSDFLVTAENDGQVFAWLPPTPGSALQRKTLSVAHTGKAWHSLERVQMTGGAEGLAGLRVTPGSPQTAEVVFWSPYDLGFTTPPII